MVELEEGIGFLEDDKATRSNCIPNEVYKRGLGDLAKSLVLNGFNSALESGVVPERLKDVEIAVLFKKGDEKVCDNYRGVSLINHEGKLFERIILNRLVKFIKENPWIIPETQFGFTSGRSTVDASWISQYLAYDALRHGDRMYKCFLDLSKAYDRVDRPILWELLRRYGIPEKLVNLIAGFHTGARAVVKLGVERSEQFELKRGLKQGSVFAPLLFNIFFGRIMNVCRDKFYDENLGVFKEFSPGNKILRPGPTNVEEDESAEPLTTRLECGDLAFADDVEFLALSPDELQKMVDIFVEVSACFGQEVSITKSKVMAMRSENVDAGGSGGCGGGSAGKACGTSTTGDAEHESGDEGSVGAEPPQGKFYRTPGGVVGGAPLNLEGAGVSVSPGAASGQDHVVEAGGRFKEPVEFQILVRGQPLEVVSKFQYLGCWENNEASMSTEVSARIQRMMGSFRSWAPRVLLNKSVTLKARLQVFNAVVVASGVYGCQSWTLSRKEMDRLEATHFKLLRKVVGCAESTPYVDVLVAVRAAGCVAYPLEGVFRKRFLRYWGHIARMNHGQLHRMVAGAFCRRYKPKMGRALTESLKLFGFAIDNWERLAQKVPLPGGKKGEMFSPWGGAHRHGNAEVHSGVGERACDKGQVRRSNGVVKGQEGGSGGCSRRGLEVHP